MRNIIILLLAVLISTAGFGQEKLDLSEHASKIAKERLKLIKEFNSYKEYSKIKGIKHKKMQAKFLDSFGNILNKNNSEKVTKETAKIKFHDSYGRVLKERKIKKYDESIHKEYIKKLKEEKTRENIAPLIFESCHLYRRDHIIIVGWDREYIAYQEVFDNEGNSIKFKGNLIIHPSLNSKYFAAFQSGGEGEVNGTIDFFDNHAKPINQTKISNYGGIYGILFSEDSRYIVITLNSYLPLELPAAEELKKLFHERKIPKTRKPIGIVAVLDNQGNILWKKSEENWWLPCHQGGGMVYMTFSPDSKHVVMSTNKGIYCFSINGQIEWIYPSITSGDIVMAFSPTGETLGIVQSGNSKFYLIDRISGKLLTESQLPDYTKHCDRFQIAYKNKYILIKMRNYSSKEYSSAAYLLNKTGEILWQREDIDYRTEMEIDLNDDGQLVIEKENKVFLYEVK